MTVISCLCVSSLVHHPHPRLVVLLQGQRGRLSSLDYNGEVEEMEMEEGDAEGEGPMVVREGQSGHGLSTDPNNANNTNTTTTTNNLLASVKEQVGRKEGRRCCSHTLLIVHSSILRLNLNMLIVLFNPPVVPPVKEGS